MKQIEIACKSDATVLITGPTGSGKTRLARQIHDSSARKLKPFASVNLATLHEGTLESELFGHEKGAYTGADQRRVGRLELARGGTVFLDEVGDLSPKLQARLLEFLQSKVIVPVGGNREITLDVRVIAATHRDLESSVAKGTFREDLFHRLRILSIDLKPLCERWEDFDELVHSILTDLCLRSGRSILRISEEVANRLEGYDWPGNIRELRNVMEYAVLASDGDSVTLADLPPWFSSSRTFAGIPADSRLLGMAACPMTTDYEDTFARFERDYLEKALMRFRGRVNYTAKKIGMNKSTLIRRIRAYGLMNVGKELD